VQIAFSRLTFARDGGDSHIAKTNAVKAADCREGVITSIIERSILHLFPGF
jgi:hypothetical protein